MNMELKSCKSKNSVYWIVWIYVDIAMSCQDSSLLLVPCSSVQPAAWSGYRQLAGPYQWRGCAGHPGGLKTRTYKAQMNLVFWVNGHPTPAMSEIVGQPGTTPSGFLHPFPWPAVSPALIWLFGMGFVTPPHKTIPITTNGTGSRGKGQSSNHGWGYARDLDLALRGGSNHSGPFAG